MLIKSRKRVDLTFSILHLQTTERLLACCEKYLSKSAFIYKRKMGTSSRRVLKHLHFGSQICLQSLYLPFPTIFQRTIFYPLCLDKS